MRSKVRNRRDHVGFGSHDWIGNYPLLASPIINKGDLVKSVARKTERSAAEVDEVVTALLGVIETTLAAGFEVNIRDFGKFELRWREPVTKPNPRTGKPMKVGGHHAIHFVPAPKLKNRVMG